MTNGFKLAIIIPYYKRNYIEEALKSIEAQTNQNFNLYIGDDASPNEIKSFIEKLDGNLKKRISYHRYVQNIGSISLTKQWERCIALSKNEEYIWLFSDDDIMPNDAVQRFYDFIDTSSATELIRFNVAIIDNVGKLVGKTEPHPPFETAKSFAERRLHRKCISTACEYIFTRSVYESNNKFVEFPLAWGSDDATWIKFSAENGIATISGSPVLWRMSGLNISSDNEKSYKSKISASILYLRFVDERFNFSSKDKLDWLIGQLNLLGNTSKAREEFYKQLFKSKLFSKTFILKHLIDRRLNHYRFKIKNIVNGI